MRSSAKARDDGGETMRVCLDDRLFVLLRIRAALTTHTGRGTDSLERDLLHLVAKVDQLVAKVDQAAGVRGAHLADIVLSWDAQPNSTPEGDPA
ncbi:hypothetical protein IV102_22155 [bacterium]|nr:hypothetical protein [bacterium]